MVVLNIQLDECLHSSRVLTLLYIKEHADTCAYHICLLHLMASVYFSALAFGQP